MTTQKFKTGTIRLGLPFVCPRYSNDDPKDGTSVSRVLRFESPYSNRWVPEPTERVVQIECYIPPQSSFPLRTVLLCTHDTPIFFFILHVRVTATTSMFTLHHRPSVTSANVTLGVFTGVQRWVLRRRTLQGLPLGDLFLFFYGVV